MEWLVSVVLYFGKDEVKEVGVCKQRRRLRFLEFLGI